MQKQKMTSSIAILPCRDHQVDITVLYKHVRYSIIINNRILRLGITLKQTRNNKKKTKLSNEIDLQLHFSHQEWNKAS